MSARLDSLREKAEAIHDGEGAYIESLGGRFAFRVDNRGQLGFQTVLAGVAVVIAAMLAVVVVDRFNSSVGPITTDYANASDAKQNLSDANDSILTGFADMASLIGPLLLVGIAVVIIALIRRAN